MTQTVAGISESFGAFFISADKRWRRHVWRNSFEMSDNNAISSFLIKTKQNKLCDMWMEEAMSVLFQWLFSSSQALLFIK